VVFKHLHEPIHAADAVPPGPVAYLVGQQLLEDSAENVADVVPSPFRGRKSSIRHQHQHTPRVVQNDVQVFDRLDVLLDRVHVGLDHFRDVLPGLFDVWTFIDVQLGGERAELLPHIVLDV